MSLLHNCICRTCGAEMVPGTLEATSDSVPNMDEVYRFMRSNPSTSWGMLVEVLGIGGSPEVSGGRFRELWRESGGAIDKKGNAWIELSVLPQVLAKIIDASNRLATTQGQRDQP